MAVDQLIELRDVNKYFGELHVLRDIDLTVGKGEVVVITGPSGSGKSTLCRTINRLEPIDSGTVKLDGQPLPAEGKALTKLRAEVGMVFQGGGQQLGVPSRPSRHLGGVAFARARAKSLKVRLFDEPTYGCIVEDRAPGEFFIAPRSDRAKDFLATILKH